MLAKALLDFPLAIARLRRFVGQSEHLSDCIDSVTVLDVKFESARLQLDHDRTSIELNIQNVANGDPLTIS